MVVAGLLAGSAEAQPLTVAYTDPVTGWEWASLIGTTGLSWNQIDAVCANDGVTACTADIGVVGLAGWTWATKDQVRDVFINASSDLTHANFDDEHEIAPYGTSEFYPT